MSTKQMALECIEAGYGHEDYEMFVGYMIQREVTNDISEKEWHKLVKKHKHH